MAAKRKKEQDQQAGPASLDVPGILPLRAKVRGGAGAADRIGLHDHRGGHSFPARARRLAYQWLDYWLGFHPPREG